MERKKAVTSFIAKVFMYVLQYNWNRSSGKKSFLIFLDEK